MWRYLFLVPVYLLSTALPLASALGANLEYEYALIASQLALLLIPAVALVLPYRYLPQQGGKYDVPAAFETLWILGLSPLIAIASGVYMFASGLCSCSVTGFGFWMLILWYPAWVLAHAVHHAVLRARIIGVKRWSIGLAAIAVYGALITAALAELWFLPQKRLTSLVLGFLHGPIYDDWIAFDTGLLLARAAHLALALALLVAVWFRRRTVMIAALAGLGIAWLGLGTLASRYPSTQSGTAALNALLPATLAGKGFTLHYRPATLTPPDSQPSLAVQRIFRDTQFHVDELSHILAPDGRKLPHVQVYLYPNDDDKKLWFGAFSTDVTDVRTPSIHIALGTWPHPTLRHELVHALASGFGYHGLGFHPNLAFTEGLAVALAPTPSPISLDDGAASLLQSGRLPPVESLFTPAFWKVAGGRAYTVAGSLIRYLIRTQGIAKVEALYAGKSWQEAFGKNQAQIVAAWKQQITAGYDKNKNELYTEALYRYPGVLHDLCPHSKADLARSRETGFYTRIRQPIGWDPKTDYMPWLLHLDPHDQGTRLRLWRGEIKTVAENRFPALGRLKTWAEALDKARAFPPKTLEDVEMAVTESDVLRLTGDTEASIKLLRALAAEGQRRNFGAATSRAIAARLGVERGAGGPLALEWRQYLAGWRRPLPDTDMHQGPWLLTYLKLRNEQEVPLATPELVRLLATVPPDPALPATFAHEWYKLLAGRLMRQGDYKDAGTAYRKAAATGEPATAEVFEEHARRADYYAAQGPLKAEAAGSPEPKNHEAKASPADAGPMLF